MLTKKAALAAAFLFHYSLQILSMQSFTCSSALKPTIFNIKIKLFKQTNGEKRN
jgi:hypothetical protein